MERDKLLMTPGPTMIPPKVLQAMSRQIIHHRTKEFQAIFTEFNTKLKTVFDTKNDVLTFASSGTGAMEASIANLFSPGDKVLVGTIGVFGDRYVKIAKAYGLDVDVISVPWGQALDPEDIKKRLDEDVDNKIKAVIVTHNETSTGVTNDLEAIGQVLKERPQLLVVDAISSLGGIPLKTDEWGIDVVVAGSQKALMVPPGLSFASLSDRAWDAVKRSKLPKFYFDFLAYREKLNDNDTPYTPAVTLIIGTNVALDMILDEGLDKVYARNRRLAEATRAAARAMGLELFAEPTHASDIITSIRGPEGIDVEKVRKIMNTKYDIMITGGQGKLKGQILRIGHVGYVDQFDLLKTLTGLEYSLAEAGYPVQIGSGVTAAEKILKEGV
jgi:aspartate aminotransferase-like enzyme